MGLLDDFALLLDRGKRNVTGGLLDPALFATRVGENVRDWGRGVMRSQGDMKSVMPEIRQQGREGTLAAADPISGLLGTTGKVKVAMSASKVPNVVKRDPVYPGIYADPRALVAEAASRVAPEHPLLYRLFDVHRGDLLSLSQHGQRKGNLQGRPYKTAKNPKGAAHAEEIMAPENTARVQDIMGEAMQQPALVEGMVPWYVMDPMYWQFERLYGKELAPEMYRKYNSFTGMASPGSEVLTEINRGTAAYMMDSMGRFGDWKKYAGIAEGKRGADFPPELVGVTSHPYHRTAHGNPMQKYVDLGALDMDSAKVPSYIDASGVPEIGFQTAYPVGDAHWSRAVGLADARPLRMKKGVVGPNRASATVPEMVSLTPWWQEQISAPVGLEAVPGQALFWGGASGATGVTSPIGAGKLELTAMQLGKTAQRMGITPEEARDRMILGKAFGGLFAGAAAVPWATAEEQP